MSTYKAPHQQQPRDNDNDAPTKTEHLESMVLHGQNIAATHNLYERLVPLAWQGLLSDYDIIIDEVAEVVKPVSSKSKVSIEGSVLSSYLKKLDVPVEVADDNQREEAFRKKASQLITIKDIPALSRLSLSHSGQLAGMSNSNYCRTVVNALKNLRGRQLKGVPAENTLLTCAKEGWHRKGKEKVASPFASGSKLFQGANWVAKVTRGTNDYASHPPLRPAHEPVCSPLAGRQHKGV
jgi:hypothetical protein